jgi:hypothetical protein
MMKLLIDRNVERFSITHRSVEEQQEVKWGNGSFVSKVIRRVAVNFDGHNRDIQAQLPYWASLCVQARRGDIDFFTSFELKMEFARQKQKPDGYVGGDLLADIPMHRTKEPASRSVVFRANAGSGLLRRRTSTEAEREQMEFFASISAPRYVAIRAAFQKAGFSGFTDDIFHFWTAEYNDLDAFLTLDFKFWRAWAAATKKGQLKSSTAVMTPKECCQRLGIGPTEIETNTRVFQE